MWASLLDLDRQVDSKICSYDPVGKVCSPVTGVEWPVLWLLSHHSPKFRLCSSLAAPSEWLGADLRNAVQRFRWRSRPGARLAPQRFYRRSGFGTQVAQCSTMTGSLEERWASRFQRTFVHIAAGLRHASIGCNMFGLLRLAIRLFRRSGLVALPLDKNPGYALISPQTFVVVENLALSSSFYSPCPRYDEFRLCLAYSALAQGIGKAIEDSRLRSSIMSSCDSRHISTRLTILVKSHKPPGEVSVRTVHRGFRQAFSGLSLWIHAVLDPIVGSWTWLAKDSGVVHSALTNLSVPAGVRVVKCDLKDFFLTGDARHISLEVSKLVEAGIRVLFYEALFFLLDNQYVQPSFQASMFKCISGSGIGLLHSAHVASAYYYACVESNMSADFASDSLLAHWRYHDDIITAHNSREFMLAHYDCRRSLSLPLFQSKLEVYSPGKDLVFLDLAIQVRVPRFAVAASQVKPVIPLCPSSAHNPEVHRGWPLSVSTRIHTLSKRDDIACLDVLYNRYLMANSHPFTCALFKCAQNRLFEPRVSKLPDDRKFCPFVLRFHPAFHEAFKRAVWLVPPPPELNIRVGVAWRNALPSIAGSVSAGSRRAIARL